MSEATIPPEGPLPLIIGVTGHRDLRPEDRPELVRAVGDIFATLKRQCPSTPLILLSMLAEGADRLVAEVALGHEVRLIVPLPLPRELYKDDFPDSVKEFQKLLGWAERAFVMPYVEGGSEAAASVPGPARDAQYAYAGGFIATNCQILIALWDGKDTKCVGGTAHIVDFQLRGVPEPYRPPGSPPFNPLDAAGSGPVYQIVTPRRGDPKPVETPMPLVERYPELFPGQGDGDDAARHVEASKHHPGHIYKAMHAHIESCNRDSIERGSATAKQQLTSRSWLFPDETQERLTPALAGLRENFALADALALDFQRWSRSVLRMLIVLGLLAVFTFALYAHPLSSWPQLLLIHLCCYGAAFGVFFAALHSKYHDKYLDYRALAEGLRVQFFWGLAGLDDSVADHYLRKQRSSLDWVRNAIRAWQLTSGLGVPGSSPTVGASVDSRDLIIRHWVNDQRDFFERAAKRDHRGEKCRERLEQVLLAVALVFACVMLLVDYRERGTFWTTQAVDSQLKGGPDEVHPWLIVAMSLAVAGTVAAGYRAQTLAFAEHRKSYQVMHAIFARASTCLSGLSPSEWGSVGGKLIVELGKEALSENADWVLLHRGRHPAPLHAA